MQNSERISALLDGAGDAGDLADLAAIAADPAARRTWARYQLIGDVLRDDGFEPIPANGVSQRIARALAAEPAPGQSPDNVVPLAAAVAARRPAPRRLVGLAAAASVAALVFFGLSQPTDRGSTLPALSASPTPATATLPVVALSAAPPAALTAAPAADAAQVSTLSAEEYQRRINSYLVNFNEQRTQMGVPGVHPYVRVVGFESARKP